MLNISTIELQPQSEIMIELSFFPEIEMVLFPIFFIRKKSAQFSKIPENSEIFDFFSEKKVSVDIRNFSPHGL